jgi:hypothetical protein
MFSKIVRRSHMYLALALTPWILVYAASTIVMNHREFVRHVLGIAPPEFEKVSEQTYSGIFPEGAAPREKAQQILRDIGLDGAFNARMAKDGKLIVVRQDVLTPRRITLDSADSRLTVEREVFHTSAFLERMHRRRGYQQPYVLDDAWAVSVDAVVIAMVFWVASGLWMWWELRATRRLGFLFGAAGLALFGLFLATI